MNARTTNRANSGAMPPAAVGMAPKRCCRRGLTLLEIVVVLVILVALAGLLLPMFGSLAFQSEANSTLENLRRLQELIINRYVPDMKDAYLTGGSSPPSGSSPAANPDGLPRLSANASPPQLKYLYVDPNAGTSSAGYNQGTGLGWNGPYVLTGQGIYPGMSSSAATNGFASGGAFGTNNDPTPLDAWGNPIVIVPVYNAPNGTSQGQLYYVLISAGSTGTLGSAVTAYGAAQAAYASTQYYLGAGGTLTTTPPVPYTGGGTIWAVATPLTATVSSNTTGTANLDNASNGPTLTFSLTESYQYWLPLK